MVLSFEGLFFPAKRWVIRVFGARANVGVAANKV